jgi:hypothetical protein
MADAGVDAGVIAGGMTGIHNAMGKLPTGAVFRCPHS